jgi:hypothetical protein
MAMNAMKHWPSVVLLLNSRDANLKHSIPALSPENRVMGSLREPQNGHPVSFYEHKKVLIFLDMK